MSVIDGLVLKISRAESGPLRALKRSLVWIFSPTVPRLPKLVLKPLRVVYELHYLVMNMFRTAYTLLYRGPLFQSRCTTFGKGVRLEGLPFVSGHLELHIGNDIRLGGKIAISSGRIFDNPRLIVKDGSAIGWNTFITVNQEVIIEEDVIVSYDCRISDTDAHPRDAAKRAAKEPPDASEVRPVRICKKAFIGNGSHIMKGVTIGEGAVIAANSVVISNIPPYSLAMGNPAEVFFKNYGVSKTPPAQTNSAQSVNG